MEYQLKPGVLSWTKDWLRRVAPARNESSPRQSSTREKAYLDVCTPGEYLLVQWCCTTVPRWGLALSRQISIRPEVKSRWENLLNPPG